MGDSKSAWNDIEDERDHQRALRDRNAKADHVMQDLMSRIDLKMDHEETLKSIRDMLNTSYPPDHWGATRMLQKQFPVSQWASRGATYKHKQDPVSQIFRYGLLEFKFEKK